MSACLRIVNYDYDRHYMKIIPRPEDCVPQELRVRVMNGTITVCVWCWGRNDLPHTSTKFQRKYILFGHRSIFGEKNGISLDYLPGANIIEASARGDISARKMAPDNLKRSSRPLLQAMMRMGDCGICLN